MYFSSTSVYRVWLLTTTNSSFLVDLKSACLEGKPGNPGFWERVTDLGRDISLVSKSEAMRLGGRSHITEAQATEVSTRSTFFLHFD